MSTNAAILAKCFQELNRVANDAIDNSQIKNIKETINKYAVMSAIAGGSATVLPAAGVLAAMAAQTGFIWSLYVKISNELKISIKDNKLKFIASAALTNITTNAGLFIVGHVAASLISLIPGVGTLTAPIVEVAIGYVLIYVSAIVYLQFLTRLFKANNGRNDFSSLSDEEIKNEIEKAAEEVDLKEAVKEGKMAYKEARENGDLKKAKENPKCPNCNASLHKDARFCSNCGLEIKK